MKVLFLYSEVMSYTLAGLKELVRGHQAEVYLMRWDHKRLTPYEPPSSEGIHYFKRSEYTDEQLVHWATSLKPDICYVSGWMDKGYLKAAKALRKMNVPVLAGMDNQWTGNLKQFAATLLSPWKVKPYFSHIIGTGMYQYEFARRLGYPRKQVLLHAVTADVPLFEKVYKNRQTGAKRILYVGRFHPVKGIELLYEAFHEIKNDHPDWELVLIGNGPLKDQFKPSEQIIIKDFLNPEQLIEEAKHASIFCLPSRREPWGVVIHEFAAAGMALLTSDVCGANTEFVKHGYNGYIFESGSKNSLKKFLLKLIESDAVKLREMGEKSHALAQHITPESWAANFVSVLNS